MTPEDLTALDAVPRGLPGERYLAWRRRVTAEQFFTLLAVSDRLGHCEPRYTYDCYIRARESA